MLGALKQSDLPGSDVVHLGEEEVLFEPDSAIHSVYFPHDCAISLFGILSGGESVEIASVGAEGLVGASALEGRHRICPRAVVQVGGRATRVPAREVNVVSKASGEVGYCLLTYIDLLLAQAFQSGICNRFHTAEQRLARFLLRHRDATGKASFLFTQEFMAECLGANRTTVVAAVSSLEQAGLIRHERGQVAVINPSSLEAKACECYRRIKDVLEEYLQSVSS